jgi:hypothetical protein
MYYMILGHDAPDSLVARRALRPDHLQRLHALREAGRLLVAGPLPAIDSPDPGPAGFVGSLLVAEFESLELARAWAMDDPYLAGGAWREVVVQPFVRVL